VKPVGHFIAVCVASVGALALVMAVPPSSFLLNYLPPAPNLDRGSRTVAGVDPGRRVGGQRRLLNQPVRLNSFPFTTAVKRSCLALRSLEYLDRPHQSLRLLLQRLRRRSRLFDQRRVLLRRLIHVANRLVDLLEARRLLGVGG